MVKDAYSGSEVLAHVSAQLIAYHAGGGAGSLFSLTLRR